MPEGRTKKRKKKKKKKKKRKKEKKRQPGLDGQDPKQNRLPEKLLFLSSCTAWAKRTEMKGRTAQEDLAQSRAFSRLRRLKTPRLEFMSYPEGGSLTITPSCH